MKNPNGVSIIRYLPSKENQSLTDQLVECYRDVFSAGPWHEWLKCEKCGKYWGKKDQGLLASWDFLHCDSPLVDFWPKENVLSDLQHEITAQSSCWLACDNEKVIGFCWGYQASISELEEKLGLPLAANIEKYFGKQNLIAYQDEVGVVSSYRGNKIAKTLVAHRLDDFLDKKLAIGIVRTRRLPEPSETYLWYKRLGYLTLAEYTDGRVILGRKLAENLFS
jgi:hypothetical protein